MSLSYTYGTSSTNNGNITSIGYSGGGTSFTQDFTYDNLNRLATSQEQSGSSWTQTNGYDRYGNRTVTAGSGTALSFSSTTNRITTSGYSYDAAGNLTADPSHAYTYDAENKILKLDTVLAYAYDGEGKRVRKYVGENTRFVYGIGGELLAEYNGSTGSITKEYLYGASGLTAVVDPTNGTEYLTPDHLGSPRVVTNSSASVTQRRDFKPFGEEITSGAGRSSGNGWSSSTSPRQKFTGYDRDTESNLDFAEARYMDSSLGRFTNPDPLMASAERRKPQTFNRYTYVNNNPLRLVDPSGMDDCDPTKKKCQAEQGPNGSPVTLAPLGTGPLAVLGSVTVEAIETVGQEIVDDFFFQQFVPAASESLTPRAMLTLPTMGAASLMILAMPKTVEPQNCPANVCPAGTGPAIETAVQLGTSTTTTDENTLGPNSIIVRGGEKPLPPLGTKFSGAFGSSVPDAAAYVPHGQIRFTTMKAIIDSGGSVVLAPEITRGGNLNIRHVNVTEGRESTFSPLMPNPVPKANRIQ